MKSATCHLLLVGLWDGGPFVTLPQVYSEHPNYPGNPLKSNLGMYRVQLSGNEYLQDKEVGIHYQIHRGIGVHQKRHQEQDKPFGVAVFIGGPPSMAFSAVMPLLRVSLRLPFLV